MNHYLEQYRESDGLITGRQEASELMPAKRDAILKSLNRRSYNGYKVRLITSEEPKTLFPPILRSTANDN